MKIIHYVGLDDTLEKIALNYKVSVKDIVEENNLLTNNLTDVKNLVIPINNQDFVVIKNLEKEIFVEVNENNINNLNDIIKNNQYFCTNELKNVEVGDKLIIKKFNVNYYVVKPLDNLNSIAKKFGLNEQELITKNKLQSNKVFIGQKIYI
jgi:LysM repeat protein